MKKRKYEHTFHSFDGDKNLKTYKKISNKMDYKKNPHNKVKISDKSKITSKKKSLNKRLDKSTEVVFHVSKNTTRKELPKYEAKQAMKKGLPIKINKLKEAPKNSKLIKRIEKNPNFKGYTTTKKEILKAKKNNK